jgi:ribosomal protein S25
MESVFLSKNGITTNDLEKKILELLGKELLSVSQIAKKLGIRRDVAAGYLEALKNQGKLDFHKVGRSNVYTVCRREKDE